MKIYERKSKEESRFIDYIGIDLVKNSKVENLNDKFRYLQFSNKYYSLLFEKFKIQFIPHTLKQMKIRRTEIIFIHLTIRERYFNPSEVKFQELSKISRNVPLPLFLNKKEEKKETVKITFSRSRDPISTHVSKFFRRTKGERENHVSIHETIHEKWPRRGLGSKEKGRPPPLPFPLKSANESKILNEPL